MNGLWRFSVAVMDTINWLPYVAVEIVVHDIVLINDGEVVNGKRLSITSRPGLRNVDKPTLGRSIPITTSCKK